MTVSINLPDASSREVPYIPEHGTSESVVLDVLCLDGHDVGSIVGHELLLSRVVGVAGHIGQVLENLNVVQYSDE